MFNKNGFNALNDREFAVLYWKCQGYTHKYIAEKWGYTEQWVQLHMTSAHRKLGIPKEMHPAQRAPIIENEVCPALMEWVEHRPEKIRGLPAPLELEDITLEPEQTTDEPFTDPSEEPIKGEEVGEEEYQRNKWDDEKRKREKAEREKINLDKPRLTSGSRPRPSLWLIALGGIVLFVGLCVLIFGNRLIQALAPRTTPTPEATGTNIPRPTHPPTLSPTPEFTSTPENTSTPAISPTPVPLPIREDFSGPYSNLWRVIGEPFVAENNINADYSGVLTTRPGETGTLLIGNSAWKDYSISFTSNGGLGGGRVIIGFRVIDLNNMILLDCQTNNHRCDWIVVFDGKFDMLIENQLLFLRDNVTLNVQGDTFRAMSASFGDTNTMLLDLPPQYKGKFSSGGIMLRVVDQASVDFIEIQPFP